MTSGPLSRRALIAGIAGLAAYGLPAPAAADYLQNVARRRQSFAIRPRSDWAGDSRPPKFALETEDVQLLVVHHTLIPGNTYRQDQVAKLLRDIYDFHTGPEKQWGDTAYNFMVDQFGEIWETREGSLAGPVVGSATGGNQGFTQLCCFLGDLSNQPPTEAATASMAWLLATLADRYEIDTSPGATVTVTSRGSSRFATGAEMTLSTLSGHRDVSLTACPGEAGYAFLQGTMPGLVNASRIPAATTTLAPPTTEAPTTTDAPTTTAAPSTVEATTTSLTEAVTPATSASLENDASEQAVSDGASATGSRSSVVPLSIGAAGVAAAAVGIFAVAKRTAADEDDDMATAGIAPVPASDSDTSDAFIDVPARLGLGPVVAAGAVAVAAPAELAPLPGPQRVWWAVEGGAPIDTERAIEELSREIHELAINSPTDSQSDRLEWTRVDSLLSKRSEHTAAAIVAARSNAVFVLRSEPCLVIVTRPDGVEKRDVGREALSIARADVARVAVHFGDDSGQPDIEVTA